MATYSLACMYAPQFIAASAAGLVFKPSSAGGGSIVPNNYTYQISVIRVANVTAAPVVLDIWRVPNGASATSQYKIINSIVVPVASNTYPYFEVTTLYGAILAPGDAIYAQAGSASALSVQGDGIVIQ